MLCCIPSSLVQSGTFLHCLPSRILLSNFLMLITPTVGKWYLGIGWICLLASCPFNLEPKHFLPLMSLPTFTVVSLLPRNPDLPLMVVISIPLQNSSLPLVKVHYATQVLAPFYSNQACYPGMTAPWEGNSVKGHRYSSWQLFPEMCFLIIVDVMTFTLHLWFFPSSFRICL